jgi:hypothetical protein
MNSQQRQYLTAARLLKISLVALMVNKEYVLHIIRNSLMEILAYHLG